MSAPYVVEYRIGGGRHVVAKTPEQSPSRLEKAVSLAREKVLDTSGATALSELQAGRPVLVLLAAGKGTRFGLAPKCVQPVCGKPLARHAVDAFSHAADGDVLCLVHYREDEVTAALGDDLAYVHSDNPAGGTAYAAFEALSVDRLEETDALLIISMGDRIVPSATFEKLIETHRAGAHEADLTLLTAVYDGGRAQGKGRIVRDSDGHVQRIVEQRDIDSMTDSVIRGELDAIDEANCPLYAIRASALRRYARDLGNANAQFQYYLTDIVETILTHGGEIRSITTRAGEPEYDLLCSDVTRPRDLALLEAILSASDTSEVRRTNNVIDAAAVIRANRPDGQVASIANQLEELLFTETAQDLGFQKDRPVGIGISGGRVRIAFMHPDMGRFFGPAWQMPTGAADADGREQIVLLTQSAEDGNIHLFPTDPDFRERLNTIPANQDAMYPGDDVDDWHSYEDFGTRMASRLLLSLGYFLDAELEERRKAGLPLPPPSLWLNNSLRRPFSLIGNALASMRTLREGTLGARVQTYLGRDGFLGMKVMTTGNIPRGGFSSSSAVTVALKNAVNELHNLDIGPDLLVHLACQAEYGTGVRAGSLDQATVQKGRAGQGALVSSNPRENYKVIGVFPVPTERITVLFPYSVDRDRQAWAWSGGYYAATANTPEPTAAELRKLTGKAAEIAAVLTRLPLERDFFPPLQDELLANGDLGETSGRGVYRVLRQLPTLISRAQLRDALQANRGWYIEQLIETQHMSAENAVSQTDVFLDSLLSGWREPTLRRGLRNGTVAEEAGVPLRAMVAYLFGEVVKNFYLIHNPDTWIDSVTRSQAGDRCFAIDPGRLPDYDQMQTPLEWEESLNGPALMDAWLHRVGAVPVDFNRGLEDERLDEGSNHPLRLLEGGNFFRGLALIDLAEAMLKRVFGNDAVAVRVNAAGQGDFFQVHIDTRQVSTEEVKDFLRHAFYRRFDLRPQQEFVEPHPGGGAAGVRLNRFDAIPELITALRQP